jgi:hypothetical protein
MHHFQPQQIVRATELRRHLGKYLAQAEEQPILIIDRSSKKKLLMTVDMAEQFSAPPRKQTTAADLNKLVGLFGKSSQSAVELQHLAYSLWHKKRS